jgi:hypothetical protein
MKSTTSDCRLWSRGRFLSIVGVLFVVQVGLILLFSDRSRLLPPLSAPSVRYRAMGASVSEDQLLRQFFVGDPAVFPLPNPHGFSGQGWLDEHPLNFKEGIQLEPQIWLDLDLSRLRADFPVLPSSVSQFVSGLVARLGTNSMVLPTSSQPILSGLAEQRSRREELFPVFLAPESIPTQSVFRLDVELNDRLLGGAPKLRSWPSDKLLSSSEVKIAVDQVGEVLAAKLDVSCGLCSFFACGSFRAGRIFRDSQPAFWAGAETGPHFPLRTLRFDLYGRRGCGSFALLAVRNAQ